MTTPIAGRAWRSASIRTGRSDLPSPRGEGEDQRFLIAHRETPCPIPTIPALRSFIDVDPASGFSDPEPALTACSRPRTASPPRVGVAIGDYVLDLWQLRAGLPVRPRRRRRVFVASSLNAFMALGPKVWSKTRARISELLRHDHPELRDNDELRKRALVPMADVKMHLPIAVSGYTDFYSSKEHATNVGVMFRGKDNALQPNWLHMPIGYNGRASTVVVSGTQGEPAARAAETADGGAAEFRAVQAARFRAGNGRGRWPAIADGRDADRTTQAEEMIFGFVHPQRLERARHPAVGIRAARAVPGQGVSPPRSARGS